KHFSLISSSLVLCSFSSLVLCSSSPLKKSLVLCFSSPPPVSLSFSSLLLYIF
ncbi:hypothetical protein Goshw_002329, partial [Gossypium schwendimanii]|nr:hypothetical protein [Gossypium schwendimanii]